jgi:lysophospholipid acyltransferase
VGPTFQYKDYADFIDKKAPFDQKRSSGFPAFITVLSAVGPFLINTLYAGPFRYEFMLEKEYTQLSLFKKLWFVYFAGFVERCKFYVGWKLSEGACILTGLGYAGKDEHGVDQWNRTQNVNIRAIEFANNPRVLLASWNTNTAEWLRRCVYNRIHPEGSKGSTTLATYGTFTMSAFWHGFYPGYYFAFIGLSLITSVNRLVRRHVRPLFLTRFSSLKVLYDFMGGLATHLIFAYIMPSFFLRTFDNAMKSYMVNYFIGHVVLFGVWIYIEHAGGAKALKKMENVSEKKKEE